MGAAVLLKQFESILGAPLDWQSRPEPERAPTGLAELDSATGGLPRGCLTEIVGPACSGRTRPPRPRFRGLPGPPAPAPGTTPRPPPPGPPANPMPKPAPRW